jgi:hypothetical protein
MATIVNPLNLYGPYVPTTFETMSSESGDVDEEKVNELIDKKIENAAFIGE